MNTFIMGFITILGDFCFWVSETRKSLGREILEYLSQKEESEEQKRVDVYYDGYHPILPWGFEKEE